MSDEMLLAVLKQGLELWKGDMALRQIHARAQEAAERIEQDSQRIDDLLHEIECQKRVIDSMEAQLSHLEEANTRLLKVNTELTKVQQAMENDLIDCHATIQTLKGQIADHE